MDDSLQKVLLAAVVQQMPAAVIIAEAPSGRVLLRSGSLPPLRQHFLLTAAKVRSN